MQDSSVFINYRRDTDSDGARAIAEAVAARFGEQLVFIDVDDIEPGTVWRDRLRKALQVSSVLVCVIGPNWLGCQDKKSGRRRLDLKEDWVRTEIEEALQCGKLIVPGASRSSGQASWLEHRQQRHRRFV